MVCQNKLDDITFQDNKLNSKNALDYILILIIIY